MSQGAQRPPARTARPAAGGDNARRGLRALPSVDELLRLVEQTEAVRGFAPAAVVRGIRQVLSGARQQIKDGAPPPTRDALIRALTDLVARDDGRHLLPVINATGVIINTNLGRAPLSPAAVRAMIEIAAGYSNLEYDLPSGDRGSRHSHVRALLCQLTGAEDALVVNNNAAAVLVTLSALAAGRAVIVSRGELVEIGGGFRVPDVMRQSGARLVEVGTTNRTRVADYVAAITEDSAALLAVHPSNFRVVGFTETPELADLVNAAHERGLLAIEDLGSGCLLPTERYGLRHEPMPTECIDVGADVVCFSGDKLLGGPQAGIIVGRKEPLARIEHHPLMRAARIDKLTLSALEATLHHYRDETAERDVPIWRMISAPISAIRARAETWAARLSAAGVRVGVEEGESTVGGGSLPGETLSTVLCTLDRPVGVRDIAEVATRLRIGPQPVVCRMLHTRLLLDPRTVLPEQDDDLLAAIERILQSVA